MFLRTLELKSDGMIIKLVRTLGQSYVDPVAPTEDRRGKNPASHKCDTKAIRLHINSYNPSIRLYKHKDAPKKLYLKPDISIKSMYVNLLQDQKNKVATYST